MFLQTFHGDGPLLQNCGDIVNTLKFFWVHGQVHLHREGDTGNSRIPLVDLFDMPLNFHPLSILFNFPFGPIPSNFSFKIDHTSSPKRNMFFRFAVSSYPPFAIIN